DYKEGKKERRKVMRNMWNSTWIVLIAALVGMLTCQASPCQASPAKLQPVEISLNGVEVVFGGTSDTVLEATFTVRNPNKYQVAVKDPECEFWTGDMNLGGKKISTTFYIPGKTTINFKSIVGVVTFKWLVFPLLLKGNSPGEAAVAALPLWKSLGGDLPDPKLKEPWDKVPAKGAAYKAMGRATVTNGTKQMVVEFASEWQSTR
ncbi:MAG: hypothetical protein Q7R34_09200, partial [Dehalococcoidia bacterium]|nr:hypothetical protein [Dehalococcoidia bacterium]